MAVATDGWTRAFLRCGRQGAYSLKHVLGQPEKEEQSLQAQLAKLILVRRRAD